MAMTTDDSATSNQPETATEGDADADAPDIETNGAPSAPKDADGLSPMFNVLSNRRRRDVIRYLREHEAGTLSNIAEFVAAKENDKPEHELTSAERKRVYVALYQTHLKRMDAAGLLDFDSDRGVVELNHDEAEMAFAHLDLATRIEAKENRWLGRALPIAVIGAVLYFASSVVLGAGSAVSLAIVLAMIVGVIAVSALEISERSELALP